MTITKLEQLSCRSFVEIIPILEKLENADLAHHQDREDIKEYIAIPLPPPLDPEP